MVIKRTTKVPRPFAVFLWIITLCGSAVVIAATVRFVVMTWRALAS